jgi:hypothetical protein
MMTCQKSRVGRFSSAEPASMRLQCLAAGKAEGLHELPMPLASMLYSGHVSSKVLQQPVHSTLSLSPNSLTTKAERRQSLPRLPCRDDW